MKTTCYRRDTHGLGFHRGESWILAELFRDGVILDKHGETPLTAGQCRDLALWLVRAAMFLDEPRPAVNRVRRRRSHGRRAGKRTNASRKAMAKKRIGKGR